MCWGSLCNERPPRLHLERTTTGYVQNHLQIFYKLKKGTFQHVKFAMLNVTRKYETGPKLASAIPVFFS